MSKGKKCRFCGRKPKYQGLYPTCQRCHDWFEKLTDLGIGWYEAGEIIEEAVKKGKDADKVIVEAITKREEYNDKPKRCFTCTKDEFVKYNIYEVWAVDKEDALQQLEEDEGSYITDSEADDHCGGEFENWKDVTEKKQALKKQSEDNERERLKRRLAELGD